MTSPVWQLDQHHARLRLAQLTAVIDLLRPAEGLGRLHFGDHCVGDVRLLGIEIPSFAPGDAELLTECRVRGSRLMAAYKESENWPVRVEATWRAEGPSASNGPLATIELVVSVETHLPDSQPELSVQSALPTSDVFRLVDQRTARFETLGREHPSVIEPGGGPGCLVFRLEGSDLSYAQMVHPLDFFQDRLEDGTESGSMVRLRHRLFRRSLEKGVMLRARICGAFLQRNDDTRIAAACYASLAAAEPPLGT